LRNDWFPDPTLERTKEALSKLVETIRLAQRCMRIIAVNFVGTLVVDGAGVALAALIHLSSELAFILNSARLCPLKRTLKCSFSLIRPLETG
jgi:hypothetical protein